MKLQKLGRQPRDLPETSSNKLVLLLSEKFELPGALVRWDYYRKQPIVPLYASVWRKLEGNKFQLVDYNELTPGVIDFQTKEIEEEEQIEVQSGDIIGVFYSRYSISGAVAMATEKGDVSKDDNGNFNEVVEVGIYEEDLSPGDVIDLDDLPHTFLNVALALQANIRVCEKI
ncbi:HSPG2 [Bugula neritina]|uniref:HSPG2 n=1 Tax=Bugula neritina TaxID=10212 RepID=A0A7J7K132_BUGNE|nr:HSPG2 [Bugula neritina]